MREKIGKDQELIVGGKQTPDKGYELVSEVVYNVPIPPPASPAHRRAIRLGLLEDMRRRYISGVETLRELSDIYKIPYKEVMQASTIQNWPKQKRDRELRMHQDWVAADRARVQKNTAVFVGEVDSMNQKLAALIHVELNRKMEQAKLRAERENYDPQRDSLNIGDLLKLGKSISEFVAVGRKNLGLDEKEDQKQLGPPCIDVDVEPVEKQQG